MMRVFNKLKSRKGLTGADVAAAVTVIVLTVGIVTGIYINTINKSKDNIRYANAIRIATGIVEDIQRKTYDEFLTELGNSNEKSASNEGKIFGTKVINGFSATVSATDVKTPDIARDVTVNVRYKASTTYKTITLTTVKARELIDAVNAPDLSMLAKVPNSYYKPYYKGDETKYYYYPVVRDGSSYKITTFSDINWYNYTASTKKAAFIWRTNSGDKNVGDVANSNDIYVWVPRYMKNGSTITFLYGSSDNPIVFSSSTNVLGYIKNNSTISVSGAFSSGDGFTGKWLSLGSATAEERTLLTNLDIGWPN